MSQVHSPTSVGNHQPNVLKGLVAGAIGGLVASWVMNEFQYAWIKVTRSVSQPDESSSDDNADSEPATVKAAEIFSERIFNHQLAKDEKRLAAEAVHYATGGASAAVYGAVAELVPEVTSAAGIPFGTAVWLVVDEGAVPLFKLSKGPTEYPLSTHIYALASHFVYGITTEVVRSGLRRSVLS